MIAPRSEHMQSIIFLHISLPQTQSILSSFPYEVACSLRVAQSLSVVVSAMFVTKWVTDKYAWKEEEKGRRQR